MVSGSVEVPSSRRRPRNEEMKFICTRSRPQRQYLALLRSRPQRSVKNCSEAFVAVCELLARSIRQAAYMPQGVSNCFLAGWLYSKQRLRGVSAAEFAGAVIASVLHER